MRKSHLKCKIRMFIKLTGEGAQGMDVTYILINEKGGGNP